MKIASACVACGNTILRKSPAILMPFVAHRVFDWQPVSITESWGLQTISTGRAYNICNTLYCDKCGMIFLDMRFDDDEMQRLYQGYRGVEYTSLRNNYEAGYLERNQNLIAENHIEFVERFLIDHIQPKRILDYGGGDGSKTPFQKTAHVDIFDIDNVASQIAPPYDLIVCAHTLEHVSRPLELLQKIYCLMDDDTLFYIELPLERVILEDLPKHHWHEHINCFSPASLWAVLWRAHLEILKYSTCQVNDLDLYMLICRKMKS